MPERLSCFVIMPYSQSSDEVYQRAILPALLHIPEADILPLRADQITQALTLKAHVESAVQSADFCIADITGGNPNVMYELGYAMANQKPVILIQETGSRQVPANLSGSLVHVYDRSKMNVFSVELKNVVRNLIGSLFTGGKRQRSEGFSANLLSDRSVFERFASSVRYSLSALVSTPRILLQHVLPRIELASRPELLVRVVCTDPEGEFSRIRSHDSGIPVSVYRAELWNELRELFNVFQQHTRSRGGLRLTNRMIGTSIYLSDEIALVFPYLAAGATRESAGIEIIRGREPQGFALFQQQFGMAWSDASPDMTEIPQGGRERGR